MRVSFFAHVFLPRLHQQEYLKHYILLAHTSRLPKPQASLVGSERVRRHPHHRTCSISKMILDGVSYGPGALSWVPVPLVLQADICESHRFRLYAAASLLLSDVISEIF